MFNINDYSKKIEGRVNQLNERFADLQTNLQLIQDEMRFIELETAGLNGQLTAFRLVLEEQKFEENINKETTLKD